MVRATGTAFERGWAIGRGLGEEIHASLAFVDRYLGAHGIDTAELDRILAPYVAASEAALPHLVEQLRGIADGSDQPFAKVMAANAFEEIYGQVEFGVGRLAPLERCTDVVFDGIDVPLLGHTEQWYAGTTGRWGSSSTSRMAGRRSSRQWWRARFRWSASTSTGWPSARCRSRRSMSGSASRGRSSPATSSTRAMPPTRRPERHDLSGRAATPTNWRSRTSLPASSRARGLERRRSPPPSTRITPSTPRWRRSPFRRHRAAWADMRARHRWRGRWTHSYSARVASKAAFSRARCSAWIGTVPRAASTNSTAIIPNTIGTPAVSPTCSMMTP